MCPSVYERKVGLEPWVLGDKQNYKIFGLQMFQGLTCNEDFEAILNHVSGKLASWKGRLFNKVGRTVLANVVLSTISIYSMHDCWFPQNVCDALDKTVSSFI